MNLAGLSRIFAVAQVIWKIPGISQLCSAIIPNRYLHGIKLITSRRGQSDQWWGDLMMGCKTECRITGVSLSKWLDSNHTTFGKALQRNTRLNIHIYLLQPNTQYSEQRNLHRSNNVDLKLNIEKFLKLKADLSPSCRPRLKIYIYNLIPSVAYHYFDGQLVVSFYLPNLPNEEAPTLMLAEPPRLSEYSLYGICIKGYEKFLESQDKITEIEGLKWEQNRKRNKRKSR